MACASGLLIYSQTTQRVGTCRVGIAHRPQDILVGGAHPTINQQTACSSPGAAECHWFRQCLLQGGTNVLPVFRVPRGQDPRETQSRRHAFTLIETLLTLCILLILGAIAWPTLERTLAGHRLQKAADQLRAEWTVARVDALESGVPYRFLYLPGGNRFRIQRADDCDPNGNGTSQQGSGTQSGSNAPSGSGTQQDSQSSMGNASVEPQREASLPEGVTFQMEQTAVAPDDPNNTSNSSQSSSTSSSGNTSSSNTPPAANAPPGASGSSSGDNAGWSDPLWFNPDGTTSTARLVLKNTYNFSVEISLRGFTGVATVCLVLAAGEKE